MAESTPKRGSMWGRGPGRATWARSVVVGLAVLALVAAACDGGGDSTDDTTTTTGDETEEREAAGIDFSGLSLPDGEAYEDFTTVTDDSETLEVEVPTAWDDVDGEGREADGETYDQIVASPDVEAFNTGYGEPGVMFNDSPVEEKAGGAPASEQKLNDYANQVGLDDACSESETFDYDDGTYTGSAELWPDCGDDDAAVLAVSAAPEQGTRLFVSVQMVTDPDIDAAIKIVETFKQVSGDSDDDEAPDDEAGPDTVERIVPDACEAAIEDGDAVLALLGDALDATTDAIAGFNADDEAGRQQAIGRLDQIGTEVGAAEDAYGTASADCRDVQEATPARCLDALDAGDQLADLIGQALDAANAAIAAYNADDTSGVDQAIGRLGQIGDEVGAVESEWNAASAECVGT